MSHSPPLHPLRVLDLSSGLPGSVVTLLLAAYGAEVIKAESATGDPSRRTGANRAWDRGKRSAVLDVRADDDRAVLVRLATEADVVVEGFRPGRLEELGLDYSSLREANPSLVYCALSGYGDATRWRDRPGIETLVAARLGLMADQPGYRDGPIFLGHPAIGYGTALLTLMAVLAALRVRYLTGRGQLVQSSMLDGILAQTTMHWASEDGFASFVRTRTGRPDFGRRRLLLDSFDCADGRMIHVHTGAVGAFSRAMRAFGLDDRISTPSASVEMSTEMTDAEVEVLRTELPELIRLRPALEWLRRLWENEVAALPLQPPGEAFDDDQVRHNGLIDTVDDPDLGEVEMVGPPIRLSVTPPIRGQAAPRLDEHADEIRRDGWSGPRAPVAAELRELKHPLEDIRIVEFSTFFAASYTGRLLSNLGADVIKVEPLNGDPMRPLFDMFEGAQGGKRAIAIDLKSPEGAQVARRLLESADIAHHNLRPGAAERLGVDYETVREFNKQVVYCYSPGFGSSGPKARLQSFAPLQSGFAGLFHEAGGDGNRPLSQFGNEDYYNGLLAGCGIMLALLHRDRANEGQYVESPQLHSTVFATTHVVKAGGELIRTIPLLDHAQTGFGPLNRLYECSEGWLCVACTSPRHERAFLGALGVDRRSDADDAELTQLLADRFTTRPASEWYTLLDAAGAPCEVAREESRRTELFMDPELVAAELTVEHDHPRCGRVYAAGLLFHLSETPGLLRDRAPLLGEHTREILTENGYPDKTVDEWLARGLARTVSADESRSGR